MRCAFYVFKSISVDQKDVEMAALFCVFIDRRYLLLSSDWGFTSPVTEFPLQVPSGTYVIAAVELEDQDPDMKLVVPNCFTTPTNNRNHEINWPLFQNK